MKILQIISSKDTGGGSQEHTRILSLGLQNRGHKVKVICRPGSLAEAYKKNGLEVYTLELREKRKAIRELVDLIREERFDVVHTHNRDGDVPGLIAAKKAGTSLIVSTIHAYINKDKLGNRKMNFPLWKYNRILKKIPHKIITLSEALRGHILQELRINPERVVTILNGVDLNRLKVSSERNVVKKELGIPEEAKVIGSVGHLIALKGYRYLIEASVEVLKAFPETRFAMVGEGNLRRELEELAKELRVRGNFIFTGKVAEVGNILQILDLFVHPSLSEGLPRSVMEASGVGIPVVATNVGGIPEVVRNKETGVLVPAKNSQALAKAITYLLNHPEEAREMGEKGKRWIEENFDVSRMVDETETILKNAL